MGKKKKNPQGKLTAPQKARRDGLFSRAPETVTRQSATSRTPHAAIPATHTRDTLVKVKISAEVGAIYLAYARIM